MPAHHIVFISDQLVPSWLPAVVPGLGATHLHAIVTDKMECRNAILQNAWQKMGVYRAYHLASIEQEAIYSVLDAIYKECGHDLLLNLTGGNKLMTLAAHEWASAYEVPTVYVDTQARRLVWPGSQKWRTEPLPDLLDVKSLLALHGYEMLAYNRAEIPSSLRNAHARIIDVLGQKGGMAAMGCLNGHAERTDKNHVVPKDASFPLFDELLAICADADKLVVDGGMLKFVDEDARKWCNGGWLEEYVASVLWNLHAEKKIRSWASCVQVRNTDGPNELDALFTVGNRLYTIECKTSRMTREQSQGAVTTMLYKAEVLQERLGGIFASSMICSAEALRDADARRAKGYHICTVCGSNLKNLKKELLQWSQ